MMFLFRIMPVLGVALLAMFALATVTGLLKRKSTDNDNPDTPLDPS